VIPVLTPKKPYLRNSLLVFYQTTSLSKFSVVFMLARYILVDTIFRYNGIPRHMMHKLQISNAVDRVSLCGRPCGLPNRVSFRPSCLARIFISFTNTLIFYLWSILGLIRPPAQSARLRAASLPLGSIRAYKSCSIV
jgi:hypothetical protein